MDIDQAFPHGGAFIPGEPEEQVKRRQEEHNKIASSMPVLEQLIADLDDEISKSKQIDLIDTESKVPVESQILALKELTKHLETFRSTITSKYRSYLESLKEQS